MCLWGRESWPLFVPIREVLSQPGFSFLHIIQDPSASGFISGLGRQLVWFLVLPFVQHDLDLSVVLPAMSKR